MRVSVSKAPLVKLSINSNPFLWHYSIRSLILFLYLRYRLLCMDIPLTQIVGFIEPFLKYLLCMDLRRVGLGIGVAM